MVKRKTAFESVETRLQSPDAISTVYGYQIRSRDLWVENDVVHVNRQYSTNERLSTRQIDLSQCYLPPNRISVNVTKFKDRPDFARIVVAVIDIYLIRNQRTKSTAATAVTIAGSVIKFLEYCWLNDIYKLRDVTPAFWDAFFRKYVVGGWPGVLDLHNRAAQVDWRTLPMARRWYKKGENEYSSDALMAAIGSNVGGSQVHLEYRRGAANGMVVRSGRGQVMSTSVVTALASHLNNLVELPKEMRALSVAVMNPYLYATSIEALPPERTNNIGPKVLAKLVAEAYRWVADYGEPIVNLVRETYVELTEREQEESDEARLFLLLDSPVRPELERLLGVRITSVRRVGDWRSGLGLLGLMRILLSAAFFLLALFNARRKDEVQSKSIGLFADSFECLDEKLKVYQCLFYCEKTSLDYLGFYVNEISYKALKVCKRLSEITWDVTVRNGGTMPVDRAKKIFCMPPRGSERLPIWYDYASDPGIGLLLERSTGETGHIALNAHMFRRAYSVVFYHRYENADLYSLAQQLDHFDLNMTYHYVLEGASRVLAHHAAALWGDGGQSRKERARRAMEQAADVKEYGKEKLYNDILEILSGTRTIGGGFAKLVQRFSRLMSGHLKYDDEKLRNNAKTISAMLIGRGHSVSPMPHGNCNAGPAKPSAKCFEKDRLAWDKASPLVCGKCPYHSMKEVHLKAIQDDLERQRAEAEKWTTDTLHATSARASLDATERLVTFYLQRNSAEQAASQ